MVIAQGEEEAACNLEASEWGVEQSDSYIPHDVKAQAGSDTTKNYCQPDISKALAVFLS